MFAESFCAVKTWFGTVTCVSSVTEPIRSNIPAWLTMGEEMERSWGDLGSLYYAKVFMRPSDPYAAVELHFPIRLQAWSLSSRVFDYRAAQGSGEIVPRGGPWSSRRAEFPDWPLDLGWPHLDSIHIDGRISWRTPHCVATWLGCNVYRAISFRPAS